MNKLNFKRHIFYNKTPVTFPVHTVMDATERTLGGAVYIQAIFKGRIIRTRLLCAKSRVAKLNCKHYPDKNYVLHSWVKS